MTISQRNIAKPNDPGRAPDITRRYVLSAGRTGTVFMENLIDGLVPGVTAVHEPASVRYQMMLANLRNEWGIGHSALAAWFTRSRRAREAAVNDTYVELNPFLCAMSDLLPEEGRPLRIVHMVREPASWARSITTFKASQQFRGIIDYVPFAKPYPSPRPPGWQRLCAYEKALWRWNWCNERILALRDRCDAYAMVRYENLFSASREHRQGAVSTIFRTLQLGLEPVVDDIPMAQRVNPAPPAKTIVDPDGFLAREICGPIARRLGYDD